MYNWGKYNPYASKKEAAVEVPARVKEQAGLVHAVYVRWDKDKNTFAAYKRIGMDTCVSWWNGVTFDSWWNCDDIPSDSVQV